MFIKRDLAPFLSHYATRFPVVAVVGPRQAGKTTLVREHFVGYKYFSLEDPDTLENVRHDPRGFLEYDYGTTGIIIDEFQNYPQLLSYMQGIIDKQRRPGYFVLTGSHNFLMNQAISQSLAGRVALLTLLPLSLKEMAAAGMLTNNLDMTLFQGGYPDVCARTDLIMAPSEFYIHYNKTYIERDVRQLVNVGNLGDFQRFMRLCAGRIGQLLNISSLADDCNISVPTVNSWLSILQASYVIFLLQPHFQNFNKRLIKSPKLYFYDTGLACWLLKITSSEQLSEHFLRGGLFESLVIAELHKQALNKCQEPNTYFWRDSHGHEVDCLIDRGDNLLPIEIKSGITLNKRFFEGLQYWCQLTGLDKQRGVVVYGGLETHKCSSGRVVSWQHIDVVNEN